MHPTHTTPDLAGVTPAEVLHCAALYLHRYGFHQGDMFALPHHDRLTPPACVQGAVKMAICGDPHAFYSPQEADLFDQALTVLAEDLGLVGEDPGEDPLAWYDTTANPAELVISWNDARGRTAAEVITALDHAADEWTTHHTTTADTAGITSGGAA